MDLDIIRQIKKHISDIIGEWNSKPGVQTANGIANVIDAINAIDDSYGISKELSSHDTYDSDFIKKLTSSITDGISFIANINMYGDFTCAYMPIIYAPSKSIGSNVNSCFQECSSLVYVAPLSGSIKTCAGMFYGCSILQEINLNGISLYGVTSMTQIFRACNSLKEVDFSGTNMKTNNANVEGLFRACASITRINFTNCDLDSASTYRYMFGECPKLADIIGLRLHPVRNASIDNLFVSCPSIKTLDLGDTDLSIITTNSSTAFNGLSGLENIIIKRLPSNSIGFNNSHNLLPEGLRNIITALYDFGEESSAGVALMLPSRAITYSGTKYYATSFNNTETTRVLASDTDSTAKVTISRVEYDALIYSNPEDEDDERCLYEFIQDGYSIEQVQAWESRPMTYYEWMNHKGWTCNIDLITLYI